MQFRPSKLSWVLIVALIGLNLLVMSGTMTGILPEVIRLAVAVASIFSLAQDWWRAREERNSQ